MESKKKKDASAFLSSFFAFMVSILLISCAQEQQVPISLHSSTALSDNICGNQFSLLGDSIDLVETSPDNQWVLLNCKSNLQNEKFVRVLRLDGSKSWDIPLEQFPWVEKDDPLSRVISSYWTKDSKYVYLRPIVCCFDHLFSHVVFVNIFSLYRLDLQTGDFTIVLSDKNRDLSPFAAEFSPNEKYLAYVDLANKPNVVNVLDLQSEKLRSIELDNHIIDTGAFVWTPDNDNLIFVTVVGWENLKDGMNLYSLSINNFSLETIIYNDLRLLYPYGDWIDDETLALRAYFDGTLWKVNMQTRLIEPDTRPTPTSPVNLP